MRIRLTNEKHGTSITVTPDKVIELVPRLYLVSTGLAVDIWRELCGRTECSCGNHQPITKHCYPHGLTGVDLVPAGMVAILDGPFVEEVSNPFITVELTDGIVTNISNVPAGYDVLVIDLDSEGPEPKETLWTEEDLRP